MAEGSVGSVYVRWGHDQCPSSSHLVYSGVAGGSVEQGDASDPQCLPLTPEDPIELNTTACSSRLRGSKYETDIPTTHNRPVLCAVCYVPEHSAVQMFPAKTTCPDGWNEEYNGYLMGHTQFTCVDSQFRTSDEFPVVDNNGYLFFFVRASCEKDTSLPCSDGQYSDGTQISCSVRTK